MLELVPITQKEANAFVKKHHRHHKPVTGSVFQIACAGLFDACDIETREEIKVIGDIVGVVMVGRPVSKDIQNQGKMFNNWTLEVNRCCTDGTPNACSILYSAAWRTAKGLGWKRLITYILDTENGASVKASNWKCLGETGGGSWNSKSRPRVDKHPIQKKILWEAI